MSELKINDDYYDLESLIREGIDNRTSIIVEFPDGRKAEALIKPVSIEDYKKLLNYSPEQMTLKIVEDNLMDLNGNTLPKDLINGMPIGLIGKISEQIGKISGIEISEENKEILKEKLKSFP